MGGFFGGQEILQSKFTFLFLIVIFTFSLYTFSKASTTHAYFPLTSVLTVKFNATSRLPEWQSEK
jgi:anaerobic C4-dicarboxylate transporter